MDDTFDVTLRTVVYRHFATTGQSPTVDREKGVHMKTTRMVEAVLIAASAFALRLAPAQQAGTKRTDLQRRDLSAPGREVVQVRVDFDPGYVAPRHTHPGEEIIYVIEGSLEYEIDSKLCEGQSRRRLVRAGRSDPHGEERRQRQRGRACHIYRREREATPHDSQVRGQRAFGSRMGEETQDYGD